MSESIPGGAVGNVHVSVPRAVFWAWISTWTTGAISIIVFLLRLAFSLEADLVRAQEQQGSMISEIKALQDRAFHVETVVSDMNTRLVVIEQTGRGDRR